MGKGYTILGKSCTWEEYCEYKEMLRKAPWGIFAHDMGKVLKTPIGLLFRCCRIRGCDLI